VGVIVEWSCRGSRQAAGYARGAVVALGTLVLGCSAQLAAVPPFSGVVRISDAPTRIVIYGDTQTRHPLEFWMKDTSKARRKVAYRIAQIRPDIVVNAGDLVDRGGNPPSWRIFDEDNAWLRRLGVPYFPVFGNHEFYGGSHATALANFFARFPYLEHRHWYSFTADSVAFLMLDSNFSKLTARECTEQLKWLQKSLDEFEAMPEIKLNVIVIHHPPFTNSANSTPDSAVVQSILPMLGGHPKVKLFFSGHSHTYERFRIGGINYIVTGGGGAPLDTLEPSTFPDDLYEGGLKRGHHYCLMTLYRQQCTIEMFELQDDGSWMVQDSVEVQY